MGRRADTKAPSTVQGLHFKSMYDKRPQPVSDVARASWLPLALAALAMQPLVACKEESSSPSLPSRTTDSTPSPAGKPTTPHVPAAAATQPSAAAAPSEKAAPQTLAPSAEPATLTVKGLGFVAPVVWTKAEPVGLGRVAQFSIAGTPEPAEVVLSNFGKGGGNVASNMARWRGQFSAAPGQSPQQRLETLKIGALTVNAITLVGSYQPMNMGAPSAATERKSDWMMRGAMIEGGPEGAVFIKITGPRAVIEPRAAEIDAFERSVRVVSE